MDFLVDMTTYVPPGTHPDEVDDIRARESVRARELVANGHLLRLWRPPLTPGQWRTFGLFAADDAERNTHHEHTKLFRASAIALPFGNPKASLMALSNSAKSSTLSGRPAHR
jgi:muconolactone delta-isomerase